MKLIDFSPDLGAVRVFDLLLGPGRVTDSLGGETISHITRIFYFNFSDEGP